MRLQTIRGALERLANLHRELAGLEASLGLRDAALQTPPSDPLGLAVFRAASEGGGDVREAELVGRAEPAWIVRSGRIVFANGAALELFGADAPAVLGRPFVERVHPDERRLAAERLATAWSSPRPPDPVETRLSRGDQDVNVEITGSQVLFGGTPAVLLMARDVTEARTLEAQLLLADRLASLGVLSAGVAHEINNPLVYVLGNLELIVQQLESVAPPRGPEGPTDDVGPLAIAAQQALKGARRIEGIVADLGEFARPPPERPQIIDPVDSLSFALRMSRRSITRRARLSINLAPLPHVQGDESRIGQVFLNLLVNAADAIPEGAPMDRHRVMVRTYTDAEGWAAVEISDTGRGVPDSDLPHLFDPFFTTKPIGKGMGLGLSICHGIVTALGGTIRVESEEGRGSCFVVRLPPAALAGSETAFKVPRSPPLPGPPRRLRPGSSAGC